MAYKFQLGDATLGGALTADGIIYASGVSSDIKGANLKGEVGVKGGGDVTLTAGYLDVNPSGDDGVLGFKMRTMAGSPAEVIHMKESNGYGELQLYDSTDGTQPRVYFYKDNNAGQNGGALSLYNASNVANLKIRSDGSIVGYLMEVGGNAVLGGALTITAGGLTVEGDSTQLNVTNVELADKMLHISSSADSLETSLNTGILFGDQTNGGYGAQVVYLSGAAEQRYIGPLAGDGTIAAYPASSETSNQGIGMKASEWYGSGAGMEGTPASFGGVKWSVQECETGTTELAVGLNFCTASFTVTLPENPANGSNYRIKAAYAASPALPVTINRAGSSDVFDNDLQTVTLDSPYAAIDFTYDGTQYWIG